jgi:hypothetical protein
MAVLALGWAVLAGSAQPGRAAQPASDRWGAVAKRLTPSASPLALSLTTTLFQYLVEHGVVRPTALEAVATPEAFRALLETTAGKDLIDVGEEMFESFARRAEKEPAQAGEWVARTSAHYVLLARLGTRAVPDLETIAEELEDCREALIGALGLEPRLIEREQLLQATLPEGVAGVAARGRIAVYLHPRRSDAAKGDLGSHGLGAARFGATLTEEGRVRLTGTIHAVYFNAYSLFVLQHEAAHLAVLLAAFDPSPVAGVLRGERELRAAFMKGYHAQPSRAGTPGRWRRRG